MSDSEMTRALSRRPAEITERERLAFYRRHIDGWTYDRIAQELDYSDRSAARKAASRGYVATVVKNAGEVEEVLAEIREDYEWNREVRDNPPQKIVPGRGPAIDSEGSPIKDLDMAGAASDRMRKLRDQHLNLRGLYPPKRTLTATLESVEALKKLAAEETTYSAEILTTESDDDDNNN